MAGLNFHSCQEMDGSDVIRFMLENVGPIATLEINVRTSKPGTKNFCGPLSLKNF